MIIYRLSHSGALARAVSLSGALSYSLAVSLSGALSYSLAASLSLAVSLPAIGQTKPHPKTAKAAHPSQNPDSAVRLYGQVNELLSACANAGVEISSTTLPAHIQRVRMGSPAFYAGLQDNDVILKGTLDNGRLQLSFRRGAALYSINLATEANTNDPHETLKTGSPATTLSTGSDKDKLATATTKDPAWKKLKDYDIVMLIDKSGSMGEPADRSGMSKWDWCSSQLSSFATEAQENTGRKLTIVTFNGEFSVKPNCTPTDVQQTFLSSKPGGATDLATPLDSVLGDYLRGPRSHPLLVVVLTDGVPATPELVERGIIDASRRINTPDQIKIVFFEIGNDPDGAALIRLLDVGLTSEGARYDIVDANTFDQLKQVGLKTALYETFNHNFKTSLRVTPSGSLQSELEIVRKQLQEARTRDAQNPSSR
jgi:Mg-chelatase subunit ChlD